MDQESISKATQIVVELLSTYGLNVVGALAILVVGKIGANFCGSLMKKALKKTRTEETLIGFFSSITKYAVLTFAVVAALSKFGIETTSFIAILGAAGLAVGLALQGSLSNFAAGVLILIFRPFRVGDLIEAAGSLGVVAEVGIFTTTLNGVDNRRIILPNASVGNGTIVNLTANPTRRVDMVVGVSYSDDLGKTKSLIEKVLAEDPRVLNDPAVTVEVKELGDSSVNFVVRPWVKTEDYWDVWFAFHRKIKETLDEEGIVIPFPQRDVHLFEESKGKAG